MGQMKAIQIEMSDMEKQIERLVAHIEELNIIISEQRIEIANLKADQ